MFSPEEIRQTTDINERVSRPYNRKEILSEKRQSRLQQKHTDMLPSLSQELSGPKLAYRQAAQLREENKRLRAELAEIEDELQRQHQEHQQHLGTLIEERNRLYERISTLEHQYQDLYQNFQEAVEEEAHKMLTEATRTIQLSAEERPKVTADLSTEERPRVTTDLMKTVELHVRQVEDKYTARALYLMRQAQRKAAQLEQELAREHQLVLNEREKLIAQQQYMQEQIKIREQVLKTRLSAGWTIKLSAMTLLMLLLLPFLQWGFLSILHREQQALLLPLILPVLICVLLAGFIFQVLHHTVSIMKTAPRPGEPVNLIKFKTEKE